ncbi:MAG TPA: hypothetical protein VIP46_15875 [Pyrinomonadaceae bacterium]
MRLVPASLSRHRRQTFRSPRPAAAPPRKTAGENTPGRRSPCRAPQTCKFSLNTRNACHTGETNTVFTRIKPAPFGTEAGLSGFMNGIDPNTNTRPFKADDPADGAPTRKLDEFRRRAIDLDILVHSPCFFDSGRRNLSLVH